MGPQEVNGYKLGPNLQFTLPSVTYDDQTPPPPATDSSKRTDMNWNGEHSPGIQPTDVKRGGDGSSVSSEK